ncbi:redoxin domain-containing protein [candidate division GN15 bacterium]|nr:redoxin domain-containing protein [candidate division GN15 bacterium]
MTSPLSHDLCVSFGSSPCLLWQGCSLAGGGGDTLADHVFEDLEEQPVRLSDLVVGNMLISVVMPTCESCLDEMLYIRDQIDNPDDYRHLVFITSANPRFMRDIKEETGLTAAFLYDPSRSTSPAMASRLFRLIS